MNGLMNGMGRNGLTDYVGRGWLLSLAAYLSHFIMDSIEGVRVTPFHQSPETHRERGGPPGISTYSNLCILYVKALYRWCTGVAEYHWSCSSMNRANSAPKLARIYACINQHHNTVVSPPLFVQQLETHYLGMYLKRAEIGFNNLGVLP